MCDPGEVLATRSRSSSVTSVLRPLTSIRTAPPFVRSAPTNVTPRRLAPNDRAKTAALTSPRRARPSAAAQAASVAPVVSTSSTSRTRAGTGRRRGPAAARRAARPRPRRPGAGRSRRRSAAERQPEPAAPLGGDQLGGIEAAARAGAPARGDRDDGSAPAGPASARTITSASRSGDPHPPAELQRRHQARARTFIRRGPCDRLDAGEHRRGRRRVVASRAARHAGQGDRPGRHGAARSSAAARRARGAGREVDTPESPRRGRCAWRATCARESRHRFRGRGWMWRLRAIATKHGLALAPPDLPALRTRLAGDRRGRDPPRLAA